MASTETPIDAEVTTHKTLAEALLGFQGEAGDLQLGKDAQGQVGSQKYKYLTLDKLMDAVRPTLTRHGLVWATLPGRDDTGSPALHFRLIHAASKEELAGAMPLMMTQEDPQRQGSALTYARRYSVSAVLGVVADDDDDAASATAPSRNGGARVTSSSPAQQTEPTATARQRGLINGKAGEKGLPPIELADIVLAATENEPRHFESQSAAEDWLRRAMDRLPARTVDTILAAIERAEPEDIPV
jgi:hypothetical protein